MIWFHLVLLLLVALMTSYLTVALLWPEWFE